MLDRRLLAISAALIEEIPDPYVPPPKPQKSWQTLDPGRQLRRLSDSALFLVTSADSAGVSLEGEDGTRLRLESKEWRTEWEKVRKKPTRKTKKKD